MNGFTLLLAAAAMGVDYGWQPSADGQLEYIVQIEPVALVAMAEGQEVVSEIDPYVKNVRRYRVRVGTDLVPRRGQPPRESIPSTEADKLLDNFEGIDFGWQPISASEMEYIIQIDASKLGALRKGEQIVGELASQAVNVTRFRIIVGNATLPRTPLGTQRQFSAQPVAAATAPSLNEAVNQPAVAGLPNAASVDASNSNAWRPPQPPANSQPPRYSVADTNAPATTSSFGADSRTQLSNAMDQIQSEWRSQTTQPQSAQYSPPNSSQLQTPSAAVIAEMLQWCAANPPPWPQSNANAVANSPNYGQPNYGQSSNAGPWNNLENYNGQHPAGNSAAPTGNATPYGNSVTDPRNTPNPADPRWSGQNSWPQQQNTWQQTAGQSGTNGYPAARDPNLDPSNGLANKTVSADTSHRDFNSMRPPESNNPNFDRNRVVSYDAAVPGNQGDPRNSQANGSGENPTGASLANTNPSDDRRTPDKEVDPDRPWAPLFWAVMALFASMGGNLWMGWIAADIYRRYQDLASDVGEESRYRERRSRRDEDDERSSRADRYDD